MTDQPSHYRPGLITFLTVIHAVGVAVLLIGGVVIGWSSGVSSAFGVTPLLSRLGSLFMALAIAAGTVGLWKARKWGWWLIAGYYSYLVLNHIFVLALLTSLADVSPDQIVLQFARSIGRGGFSLVILVLLFGRRLSDYFGFTMARWKRALLLATGASAAVFVIGVAALLLGGA